LHLTLVFLGERPPEQVGEIAEAVGAACADARPFSLTVAGHGCFPSPARARVLWIGLAGETSALTLLQHAILTALVAARLAEPGERFSPHLTLGRVRETTSPTARADLGRRWLALPPPAPTVFPVREVHLISSILGPGGSRYTTLHTLPLGDP
jgi:2'-5' RNA ligase